jgi:hypothetical protein
MALVVSPSFKNSRIIIYNALHLIRNMVDWPRSPWNSFVGNALKPAITIEYGGGTFTKRDKASLTGLAKKLTQNLPNELIIRVLELAFKDFGFGSTDPKSRIRVGTERTLTIQPDGKHRFFFKRNYSENRILQRAYSALTLFMDPTAVGSMLAELTTKLFIDSHTPIELHTQIQSMRIDNLDMTPFLKSTSFSQYANSIRVLHWNIGTTVFSKEDHWISDNSVRNALIFNQRRPKLVHKVNFLGGHHDHDFRTYYQSGIQTNLNFALNQMQTMENLIHCEIFLWGIYVDAPLLKSSTALSRENISEMQVLRRNIIQRGGQLLLHMRVAPHHYSYDIQESIFPVRYFRGATWQTTSGFMKQEDFKVPDTSNFGRYGDDDVYPPKPATSRKYHMFFGINQPKQKYEKGQKYLDGSVSSDSDA